MLEDFGRVLEEQGVVVKSINLCDMRQSMQYNPFNYIHSQEDLQKLITNLIANTTPKQGASSQDPFWEKAETLYLMGIFAYVWLECPRNDLPSAEYYNADSPRLERNFRTVLRLLSEAEVSDNPNVKSKLTIRMEELEEKHPLGDSHPAVQNYYKCIRGAGDTVRSIIISANSRFAPFDNENLLRILDDDDMDIKSIGIGKDGDEKTRTALFCIIPDEDTTFNFVIGMLYTQMFQILYQQARYYNGKLPIDVGFWFDEFANIAMPDDFDRILATARSRNIYCTVVLQSLAQIKSLYKDKWEGLIGNCDTFIYLGGNEQSTHKYVSEMLGKWTIDKRTTGQTLGSHGSSSRNEDVLGRELMTPDEVSRMDNNYCIVFVRGQYPIYDRKWFLFTAPEYKHAKSLGVYSYHPQVEEDPKTGRLTTIRPKESVEYLTPESFEYYKRAKEQGENIIIYTISADAFFSTDFQPPTSVDLDDLESEEDFMRDIMKWEKTQKMEEEEAFAEEAEKSGYSSITNLRDLLTSSLPYSDAQMEEISIMMEERLPEEKILEFANIAYSPARMKMLREGWKLDRLNAVNGHS